MYKCIFDKSKDCPVRAEYKLAPESLAKFCGPCRSYMEDHQVFQWFEYMKERGYVGTLTDFLGDCTKHYFREHGLQLAVIVSALEPSVDDVKEQSASSLKSPKRKR
ncbi:hypothetical protein MUP77_14770 [Candidatus Bathyarchaeota archaeon]|nr:hypothetical protein [Candidatus Bathyarchaeota archaeon]